MSDKSGSKHDIAYIWWLMMLFFYETRMDMKFAFSRRVSLSHIDELNTRNCLSERAFPSLNMSIRLNPITCMFIHFELHTYTRQVSFRIVDRRKLKAHAIKSFHRSLGRLIGKSYFIQEKLFVPWRGDGNSKGEPIKLTQTCMTHHTKKHNGGGAREKICLSFLMNLRRNEMEIIWKMFLSSSAVDWNDKVLTLTRSTTQRL